MVNDTIADMLTRIRNANAVKAEKTSVPYSVVNKEIADIMVREGYLASAKVEGDSKKEIVVVLRYRKDGSRVISGLKRISKPGLRAYATVDSLPKVLNGLGMAVLTTSKGVMTDKEARKADVGGEVLCYVW